jgi:hypothetical protein
MMAEPFGVQLDPRHLVRATGQTVNWPDDFCTLSSTARLTLRIGGRLGTDSRWPMGFGAGDGYDYRVGDSAVGAYSPRA